MTPEFGAALCSASAMIKKPVSVLLNKKGGPAAVFVGDADEIDISSFFKRRHVRGRGIRNYRLVHTHMDGRGLTEKDKFTLVNERLEMIGVIKMPKNGSSSEAGFELAYPLPPENNPDNSEKWETAGFADYRRVDINLEESLLPVRNRQSVMASRPPIADDGDVFLVGIGRTSQSEAGDSLEELKKLAASAGKQILASTVCMLGKRRRTGGNTVLGGKKLMDILMLAGHKGADAVVFDTELTPSEASEIQSRTDMKIVDRTQLILEIFSLRASSREGKIQVRLAELKYALPRLSGKGVRMSQPGAGIGTRGPGEKALEKERRHLRNQIKDLERQIDGISGRRSRTRKNRMRQNTELVSLMGYTNAGKSTLFSALTKQRTEVADRMFSTLGTKTRRFFSPAGAKLLLTDTVGFIKDLPEDLTAAFRATLEELGEAGLLLHVADAGDPLVENKIDTVDHMIDSMGFGGVRKLLVFNKTDTAEPRRIKELSFIYPDAVFVSALLRKNLGEVVSRVEFFVCNSGRPRLAM